jgi:formamidopyrimidine-DNA glycosylase
LLGGRPVAAPTSEIWSWKKGGIMPELPAVEHGRRLAETIVRGARIERVRCADDRIVFDGVTPRRVRETLRGATVREVHRRGKHLWFELDGDWHPLFHFGMTGAFRTRTSRPLVLISSGAGPEGEEWPPRFWKILLRTDSGDELAMTNRRRLGRIRLRRDPRNEPPIANLGFDPLLDPPSPAEFVDRLRARHAVLKAVLLDQSFAAGVGNWIADEALYQARIDPRRRASELTPAEARRLRTKLLSVVKRAVDVDARQEKFPRAWLFHRRWGRPAAASTARGEPVEFLTVAGRTTAWVPSRQR